MLCVLFVYQSYKNGLSIETFCRRRHSSHWSARRVSYSNNYCACTRVNNIMWSCHKHASQMYRFGEILLWCLLIVRSMTVHADPSSCVDRFEVHRDKIIRTEDSKKLGAKFIDSMSQRNRFECLELCCRTSRCDVFVFEEKVIPAKFIY